MTQKNPDMAHIQERKNGIWYLLRKLSLQEKHDYMSFVLSTFFYYQFVNYEDDNDNEDDNENKNKNEDEDEDEDEDELGYNMLEYAGIGRIGWTWLEKAGKFCNRLVQAGLYHFGIGWTRVDQAGIG